MALVEYMQEVLLQEVLHGNNSIFSTITSAGGGGGGSHPQSGVLHLVIQEVLDQVVELGLVLVVEQVMFLQLVHLKEIMAGTCSAKSHTFSYRCWRWRWWSNSSWLQMQVIQVLQQQEELVLATSCTVTGSPVTKIRWWRWRTKN